jgi:amidase
MSGVPIDRGQLGSRGEDETDICLLPIRKQAALIRSGALSATELLDLHLQRVAAVNPAVNAIVSLDPERAHLEASAADSAMARGEPLGPLHGLPAAIKDVHDVAGLPTTQGSPLLASTVATSDEMIVARIRAAGAIVIGKTNVPEFSMGAYTDNKVFGPTRNPYDPTRSPGGSSGGAAAALATGMVAICEGSDLGGSLRIPAAFCNVVGLRPSPGRVPDSPSMFGWQPLFVKGPMGRCVDDAALLLSVIAGPHPASPIRLDDDPSIFAAISPADLRGLRVAWAPDLGGSVELEPAVRKVLAQQLEVLLDLGCVIEEASIDFDGADEAFRTLRSWMLAYQMDDVFRNHRDELSPNLVWNIEEGQWLSGRDIAAALESQTSLFQRTREFFTRYDLLVCAAASAPPFSLQHEFPPYINGVEQTTYLDWLRIAYDITMTGCPALALPAGFTPTGAPVGMQLVGPHRADRRLLSIGLAVEAANAGIRRTPDLPSLARRGLTIVREA